MAELTDEQIEAAEARGRQARSTEPRAAAARYDRTSGRIILDLTNGCAFAFPARLAEGLGEAGEQDIAQVEILGAGTGLHWETLDLDLSVPDLLNGLFGTRAHMARLAGQRRSEAKTAAARANGAKGGRPRRRA